MNDFTTTYPETVKLDANKRVNYVHGLVLGVDEFLQEELYLLEKHRLHNRSLHGYGTICGLWVDKEDTGNGPLIKVGAGIAVNPKGQEIRVPLDQCALLNEWLTHHQTEVEGALGSPPSSLLSLYLVLCYRECETDRVPIPTGPCQSLEETSAASRIADDFELKFTTKKPQQTEDDTTKELFDLLSQIEIADTSPGLTQEDLENLVRSLGPQASPPVASPPEADLTLHPDNAREYLRAAFKVWVTEVRPKLFDSDCNCASGPLQEECVLLAQLNFDVDLTEAGYRVSDSGNVEFDESERPYLLSARLLQEYFLTRFASGVGGGVTTHSSLSGLATGDDHPQYLNESRGDARYFTQSAADIRFVRGAAGPYMIVAAGRFDAQGESRGPVYNQLKASPVQGRPGLYNLVFRGYTNPDLEDSKHTYIVKVTAESAAGTFHVVRFLNNRFCIHITGEAGFMVEISAVGRL